MISYNIHLPIAQGDSYEQQIQKETDRNDFSSENVEDGKVELSFDKNMSDSAIVECKKQIDQILEDYMIPYIRRPKEKIEEMKNDLHGLLEIDERKIDFQYTVSTDNPQPQQNNLESI